MKNKKKILIIVAIILVIVVALAGTVAGFVLTGKVAITSRQKLAKGLSDLTSMISMTELEDNFKEREKLQTMPFEVENVITANINKMELEDTSEMQEILDEVKKVVNDTTITNTIQADLRNNIIRENLKINLADVVEEISVDVEYNKDSLSLRSKELNEKYLAINKSDVESEEEYSELLEVFQLFEEVCNRQSTSLYLTDAEKAHFAEHYKDIFSNYIKDDMIKEEKATITVDGETKECNNVNFTLTGNQIVELTGIYLNKLEQDTEGKRIIVNKIQSMANSFEEDDLQELIDDLRNDLLELNEDSNIKISIYCTMFKTYGVNIKLDGIIDEERTTIEMDMVLGEETGKINLISDGETVLEATKTKDTITITFELGEVTIKTEGNRTTVVLEIYVEEYDGKLKITLTNDIISKTENASTTNSSIGLLFAQGENDIDIKLNMNTNLRYLTSIDTITIQNSNSLNPITASQEELQAYLEEIQNNGVVLLQTATQNSKFVEMAYSLLRILHPTISPYVSTFPEVPTNIDSTDSKTFNNMFQPYTGNQTGSNIRNLLQTLSTSNETNATHKISVSITEDETTILNATTDSQEINSSRVNVHLNNQYIILVTSLDDAGYITGIQIKKV